MVVTLTLAACGGSVAPVADGGPAIDAGRTDGGASGCAACTSAQFCQYDDTCGASAGTCKPRPDACPAIYAPVCGRDGKVHASECDANAAGVDVAPDGGCTAPDGWVACGRGFCEGSMSYCQSSANDVAGPGQPCAFYNCLPLPPACAKSSDCACFGANAPCVCARDPGGFRVSCPGG